MKAYLSLILVLVFALSGPALAPESSLAFSSVKDSQTGLVLLAASSEDTSKPTEVVSDRAIEDEYKDYEDFDEDADEYAAQKIQEEMVTIADPLEPINRAVHQFNDKLYFWALKPVAQGYKAVVPEPARVSVKNFFSNLGFPARFLSCLLQADFSGAATEAGRFTINTIWGVGGFLDPSSQEKLNLQQQDTDLGQTLGVYGVGHGFYLVWPVFGPSSPRDTVTIVGDYFLYPVSYISPWYAGVGVRTYEEVNATSLRIGDYEALKNAAIDPYVAFRDAYIQYRLKKVKARKGKFLNPASQEDNMPAQNKTLPEKSN
jgi:phospholipid-binding lipoprotein MlaA